MATINYFVRGKKKLVPVFVRFLDGREHDFMIKSGIMVNPDEWSNRMQSLKRQESEADTELIKKLTDLKGSLSNELRIYKGKYSRDWLQGVINRYNKVDEEGQSVTLNSYIDSYIKKAESGEKHKAKTESNIKPDSIKPWKGFQRIFNHFQGIYNEKDIADFTEKKKPLRPLRTLDFNDIDEAFIKEFRHWLSSEGYKTNTIHRFVKELKYFMKNSLKDKKHTNKIFQDSDAFSIKKEPVDSIFLDDSEIDKIASLDLSPFPELDIARDCFLAMCETAVRVSDLPQISTDIRTVDGVKLIYLNQQKTGGQVILPLSPRLESIIEKYRGNIPVIREQYINKRIKTVAKMAGLNQLITQKETIRGKIVQINTPKWKLVTCHTGRRSAATNLYLAEIPSLDIMAITGHTSEKIFRSYIKADKLQIALKMAKHERFSNGKSNLKAV